MIKFNMPLAIGNEERYIQDVIKSGHYCGGGHYSQKCQNWFVDNLGAKKTFLTPSCTSALEMAAVLIGVEPGDEIIMPSYTFVSTANAFHLFGAKIVFVDIRKDTMNLDETLIEAAINERTKAIVPVHYAGVSCEMDAIMLLAEKYGLFVIEDAAQGIGSYYNGKALGTIGHIGCISFHETKNIHSGGEGGALLLNDTSLVERAEIIQEKGTNRSKFLQGQIDKYTWVDKGSSYLLGELNAAFLFSQLESLECSQMIRLKIWEAYYCLFLNDLELMKYIELPSIPSEVQQNAHMFYIKVKDSEKRYELLNHLKKNEIQAVFHYIPLHTSSYGQLNTVFSGTDICTTKESEKLIRLPMHCDLSLEDVALVYNTVKSFFTNYK